MSKRILQCMYLCILSFFGREMPSIQGSRVQRCLYTANSGETNGLPLEPAMIAKERGNVTPLLRLGRGQGEQGRLHTAGFPQGDKKMPMLGGDGILDLFLVVATVREDDHLTRIIGTDVVFQVQLLDVIHPEIMLGAILQGMISARALARERHGTKRDQHVIEEHDDIGPLM